MLTRIKHSAPLRPARAIYRSLKSDHLNFVPEGVISKPDISERSEPEPSGTTEAQDLWVQKAKSLAPLVGQHRDAGEAERHLPPAIFDAFDEAGFSRMLVPRAFGGEQLGLSEALAVVEEFSRQDGATGWNAWIYIAHGAIADYLPEATAAEVYTNGRAFIAGNVTSYADCRAEVVNGGYRLSGRWPFASGSHSANWLLAGAPLWHKGRLQTYPDGSPVINAFILPAGHCEIIDSWHTTGMRGTGSNDFTVSDVFVKEDFSVPVTRIWSTQPERPSLGFGRPFAEIGAPMLGAVALGVARSAIDCFVELMNQRAGAHGAEITAAALENIGRAESSIQAVRGYLYKTARMIDELPRGAQAMNEHAGVTGALAAMTAEQVTDALYASAGTRAIYANSRLERCFRDVHMITHHGLVGAKAFVEAGRLLATSMR